MNCTNTLPQDNTLTRLIEVTRGLAGPSGSIQDNALVESCHYGALAVVDSSGRLLAAAGDPMQRAFLRSAAKPLQALPAVAAGAIDRFGVTPDELAVICASHHGTEEHVARVQSILERIGLPPTALRCGSHWPIDEEAGRRLASAGQEPDTRHSNCSGKHAGMLALARHWNCEQQDYTQYEHPVQQAIVHRLSQLAGWPVADISYASDGCTVPTFALPLAHVALAFARLIAPDAPADCRRVVAAMQSYPHLVSGRSALDARLMAGGAGCIVSKGGAEGYEGLGVHTPDGRSLGVAVKISDGSARGMGPLLAALLEALALVDGETLARLEPLRRLPVANRRNEIVGEIRPTSPLPLTCFDPPLPLETPT